MHPKVDQLVEGIAIPNSPDEGRTDEGGESDVLEGAT